MTDVATLTNATDGDNGTGVFDVLMQAVQRHLTEQYDEGRLHGADYATVYLGSMQAAMAEAIKYITENKHTEAGGTIDLQKQKLQEEIDLVIAQTAGAYESVQASQQDTVRKNLLNSQNVIKIGKESELLTSQNTELLLNGPIDRDLKAEQSTATTSGALDNTNKTNAEVALLNAREAEEEAGTIRKDAESTQKILLMQAQTQGFVSDTKQKVLKQMLEGYAVNLSISGTATVPDATKDVAIDALSGEILSDIGSSVVIT